MTAAEQLTLWQQGWTERHDALLANVAREMASSPESLAGAMRRADFDAVVTLAADLLECDSRESVQSALSNFTTYVAKGDH